MKKILALLLFLAMTVSLLAGCGIRNNPSNSSGDDGSNATSGNKTPIPNTELGDDDDTFGDALDDMGIYDGYFEEESTDVDILCVSGTVNAYSLNGTTLTFGTIAEDTVYSISGKLKGSIVIDVAEDYKLELELTGFSLVSAEANPILVKSGNKVTITAKKGTENYIYDMRAAVDETDTSLTKGAIYSEVDLKIGGKGSLSVVSENNNGIHTKDDLEVKNLTLNVACEDNPLKGNDSVEVTGGTTILISKRGDGIKTANSNVSSKGNQRGAVSIIDANLTIYAACDGIDASYNALVDGDNTILNIYTDKYSNYSEEVTAASGENYGGTNYAANVGKNIALAGPVGGPSGGFGGGPGGGFGGPGGGFGGHGGMGEGNSDKGDHSTKGIKAANEIIINIGSVSIKSYDDALHTDNSAALESGETPLGNITVNGGNLSLYSNDDGIHAENAVYIKGGSIDVVNSYEGIEGAQIFVSGGNVSVYATDDGMNSTATSGTGITLSGGYVYIYCTGDGIDSNSRTSYSGISFEGGDAVIISNSGMNSAIDTEQGYRYTAGSIVAIMPSGGMSSEAKHCQSFSSVGTSKNMSLASGSTLTISGDLNKTLTMPCSMGGLVIVLNKNTSVTN